MKCEARIVHEYKSRKADAVPPVCYPNGAMAEPNPHAEGKPVCGGEVTVVVRAADEPTFGDHYATLEVAATCSRCRYPYWLGKERLDVDPGAELGAAYMLVIGAAQAKAPVVVLYGPAQAEPDDKVTA